VVALDSVITHTSAWFLDGEIHQLVILQVIVVKGFIIISLVVVQIEVLLAPFSVVFYGLHDRINFSVVFITKVITEIAIANLTQTYYSTE